MDRGVVGKSNRHLGDGRPIRLDIAATLFCALLGLMSAPSHAAAKSPPAEVSAQPAHTNRLIDSNDPYLLLHAHNPVDWYPWGPEALARAKKENRPIFVSFGYSTCYWCHVAERTIYSDPEIARLMNEWFINIKVDREQRPDLDGVYMLATLLMTGHGGWPNNVFLTPDLKPFYAGSFFPPADDAFGRPGFPTILRSLHAAWIDRRPAVLEQGEKVAQAMRNAQQRIPTASTAAVKPAELLAQGRTAMLRTYDARNGGFGSGSAKFPREPLLNLLLADYRSSRDAATHEALTRTLDAMALGGIHDHLGGGFHRYSTEPTWSVPHFEKMLYDNAQLLEIYAEAYQATRTALYRQVADDIATYLLQRMMAPGGGFYAAQDAEVAGREGASYLWTRKEIVSILGPPLAQRFFRVYELVPVPEQRGESLIASDGQAVLRVRLPVTDTVARAGGGDIASVVASLAPARAKLFTARQRRAQPARDDKIIVAWNAMAIDALARSGQILNDARYTAAARKAANRLWTQAYEPKLGKLKHEIFRDRPQIEGYLDDYALLALAFLSLGDATGEAVWRERAEQLANSLLNLFAQGGILVTTLAANDLPVQPQDEGDNMMPSGTSAAVELLLRLHAATGKSEYAGAASRFVARIDDALQQHPSEWASAVVAINQYPLTPAANARRETSTAGPLANLTVLDSAEHVRATGEARSAGDHDQITVTVLVDKGYHINANPASFDYLIPTSLAVNGASGIQVTYPGSTLITPKFAPEGLQVYEGKVTLRATAPKGALTQGNAASAELRVQACTEEICLPPAKVPITIQWK